MTRFYLFLVVLTLALTACQRSSTQILQPSTGEGSSAPHLAKTMDGDVVLSYLEPAGASMELRYTVLHGKSWSAPQTVASGTNWFVSWADIPSVAPITASVWAAHWRMNSDAGALSYDSLISISTDAGLTWQPPELLNKDGLLAEHGFVSLFSQAEGVGAVWLDGRAYAAKKTIDARAGAQLRAVTLTVENERLDETIVDSFVCDCCQTDAAVSDSGPVIVYRDRSSTEVRDIYTTRLVDGRWTEGHAVASDGWKINGCPINGPAIDAIGSRLAIAWYTAVPSPRVQVVFSTDNGETFSSPVTLAAAMPLGRVNVALIADGPTAVSWLEQSDGRLKVQLVATDGTLGSPIEVASIQTNRNAGFPKMVHTTDRLIFAWTDVAAEKSRIRTIEVVL